MGGHKTSVPRSQKRTSRIENFIENIKLEYHVKLIKLHTKITFFNTYHTKQVFKETITQGCMNFFLIYRRKYIKQSYILY